MNGMLKKRKKKKPASPSPKTKAKTKLKAQAKAPKRIYRRISVRKIEEFQEDLIELRDQARREAVRLQPSSNAALCQNYTGQAKAFDRVISLAEGLKG